MVGDTGHTYLLVEKRCLLSLLRRHISTPIGYRSHLVAHRVGRYRVYHQSVIDFLGHQRIFIEHRQSLNNYYIQPTDWHKKLADVCELGNLPIIWDDVIRNPVEQSRREYARRYYITHLYLAEEW